MVKLVKYLFVLPPPPRLAWPSTSLQVYGNTLNHKNWKGEETSRH